MNRGLLFKPELKYSSLLILGQIIVVVSPLQTLNRELATSVGKFLKLEPSTPESSP